MKTEIYISGQPMGNSRLKKAIDNGKCQTIKSFSNYTLVFDNKKDAIKALADGNQEIKRFDRDDPNYSYIRGVMLSYDASTAKIIIN